MTPLKCSAEADGSRSHSDDDFQQPNKTGSRKRTRAFVSPTMAGIFAAALPSAEAVKNQLLVWHPHCVPRIRGSGSGGRHVRFSCKKEGSGCRLNVSCVKINNGLSFRMSAATYRPGNCSQFNLGVRPAQIHAPSEQSLQSDEQSAPAPNMECGLCSQVVIPSQFIRCCQNGHVLCRLCFNGMVRNQVTGAAKARFVLSKTVYCVVCRPQTAISMRNAAQHLSSDVWNQYLSAMSEADVVAEQQRFESILNLSMSFLSSSMKPCVVASILLSA